MNAPAKDSAGSAHLDMLRGVAALTVFVGHLRALMFVDYPSLARKGPIAALSYFSAGLGHQAVIVFFVLSGFLVGGSVLGKISLSRFSFSSYASSRLARLYAALIPSLVIGMVLDIIGSHYLGGATYRPGFAYVVPYSFGHSLHAVVLLGNLAFLQTISVVPLGTNGPLWSLANEFWYYVAFPCAVVALSPRFRHQIRAASAVVLICVLAMAARPLGALFGVWLLGAVVAALPVKRLKISVVVLAWTAVAAALGYSRLNGGSLFLDYGLGTATAAVVYFAASSTAPNRGTVYDRFSSFLARGSYTLYVAHFPAIVFVSALLLHGRRIQPDSRGMMLGGVAMAVTIGYCAILWNLGERHTDRLRRAIDVVLARPKRTRLSGHGVVSVSVTPEGKQSDAENIKEQVQA